MKWESKGYERIDGEGDEARYVIERQRGLTVTIPMHRRVAFKTNNEPINAMKQLAQDIETFLLWRRGHYEMRKLAESTAVELGPKK
jgi:hypothetical protein